MTRPPPRAAPARPASLLARAAARLALLAVLSPPPLAVAAGPVAGRLPVTATPGALNLAEGSRATLRIAGVSEPPVVAASVGRVDALREVASGIYEAEYVPPDDLDPQIAFVTVLSSSGYGFVPIALSGVREVEVSARYGTPVSVTVDDEAFGPVPADRTGRAVVRVVVPPGVHTARFGKQSIDLGAVEKGLSHVFLSRSTLDANLGAEVTVHAVVVTAHGAPRAGARLTLVAEDGTISPVVEVERGVFQASWRVGPGKVRRTQISARVDGRPASAATLERVPGPPHAIGIELDHDRMVGGEEDELAVTARVLDVAGNPTEAEIRLVINSGTALAWERTGMGRYEGRIQVPGRRSGSQPLEIRVVAPGPLVATRTVPLLPGPAAQVRVETQGDLRADGRPHELRVSVLDREGNHVEAAEVPSVTASRGTLDAPVRLAPGAYRLAFRAPLAADDFDGVVRARVGSLHGEAPLRVRAIGGILVLAPKAGYVLGTGKLKSPSAGAEVSLWLPSLRQGLGLVLEGQVFAFSRTDDVQGVALKSSASFLALEASLAWRRPVQGWMLWLGAGGGATHASSKVSGLSGQANDSGASWAGTAHGSVALGRPWGPGIPFVEAKVAWQADPGRGPVRGAFEMLTLSIGYRLDVL